MGIIYFIVMTIINSKKSVLVENTESCAHLSPETHFINEKG